MNQSKTNKDAAGSTGKSKEDMNILQERLSKYEALYNSMNEGVCEHEIVYNKEGKAVDYRILSINAAYTRILGLKEEDVVNRLASELYNSSPPPYLNVYTKVAETQEPAQFETHFPPLDKHFFISAISPEKGRFATVFTDLTGVKLTENALIESEKEKSAILNSMMNAFVFFESVFDEQGAFISYRFVSINKAYEQITGVKDEEVRGKTVHEVWPDTEPEWILRYGEVAITGKSQKFDLYHDPTKKHYHCNVYRPFETNKRFCVIFEDITEQIKRRERIEHLNNVLKAIRNVNQLIVQENDPEELIGKACDNLTETLGYHSAWIALLDTHTSEFLHVSASGFEKGSVAMTNLLREGRRPSCFENSLHGDEVIITNDPKNDCPDCPLAQSYENHSGMTKRLHFGGSTYGVLSVSVPKNFARDKEEQELFDELAGDLAFALHKIAEQEEINRLTTIVETLPVPISLISKDYRYLAVNNGYAELFRIEKKQIIGKTPAELIPGNTYEKEIKPRLDRCMKGESIRYEIEVEFPQKGMRWMEMNYFPSYNKQGKINGIIVHGNDITDRKAALIAEKKLADRINAGMRAGNLAWWEMHLPSGKIILDDRKAEMLGYKPERFQHYNDFMKLVHPDDHEAAMQAMRDHMAGQAANYEVEYRIKTKKGDYLWFRDIGAITENTKAGIRVVGIVNDITKQKQAESELRENLELNRAMIQNSMDCIKLLDLEGKLLFMSKGGQELLEIDNIELFLHKSWTELWTGEDRENAKKAINQALNRKTGYFEGYSPSAKGKPRWWSVLISPIYNKHGEVSSLLAVSRDITEKKKAEQALFENKEKLRNIIENSTNLFYTHTPEHKITYLSPQCRDYLDCEPEEGMVRWTEFATDNPVNEEGFKNTEKAIKTGKRQPAYELELESAKGRKLWVRVNEAPVVENRKTIAIVGSLTDVTQSKQAREALKKSEENLRITLNSIGDAVISTDLKGNVVRMNPIAQQLTAWTLEQAKGEPLTNVFNIVHAKTRKIVENPVEKVIKEGEIVGLANHTMLIARDGKEYQIADSAAPIKDKNGDIYGVVLVFRDVTYEYKVKEALRASEHQLRTLFETANDGIVIHEGNIVINCNEAAVKLYGCKSKEELIGHTASDFSPEFQPGGERSESKSIRMIEAAISGRPQQFYWQGRKKDGSLFEAEISLNSLIVNGRQLIQAMVRDVSERLKIEKALRESELQKDLILNSTKEMVSYYDTDLRIIWANRTSIESAGLKPEEIVGKYRYEIWHNKQEPCGTCPVERARDTKEYSEEEYTTPDGKIWYLRAYPILNKNNEVVALVEFGMDITEEKRAEMALQKSISRFNHAMNASQDGLFDWDLITNHIYYSPGWKRMLGYESNELPNDFSIWEKLTHPEDVERSWKMQQELISKQRDRFELEFRMKHKDGHWVNILSRAKAIFNEKGEAIKIVGTHVDITELKKIQEELTKAKEKAEESDRLKSAFLANMSHEIRTPMNGILGFADLLKEPALKSAEKNQYIQIIENSGRRMLNIINDLMDISRIEAGQVEVELTDSNINETIDSLHDFFQPEATKKGITLEKQTELPDEQAMIRTDKEKLYAIFTNLIKNALKYTNEGKITFGYRKGEDRFEFFVRDTGIGIPEERQKAIFDRFVQADLRIASPYEGAGLGLSITKAYVEMLGGSIHLQSEAGKGSVFYFTIPDTIINTTINIKANSEKMKKQNLSLENMKILIVEDDKSSSMYFDKLFEGKVKGLLLAETGSEAIEIMKANQDVNLILMDIKMPTMDGYQATRKIREFNKEVIIIAQTAYAMSGDREKAIAAGCNDYIAKPVKKDQLFELIGKYLKKQV